MNTIVGPEPGYHEALELARSALGTRRARVLLMGGLALCILTLPDGGGDFTVATAPDWIGLMGKIREVGGAAKMLERCRDADRKAAGA